MNVNKMLEFDKVIERWKLLAVTEYAKKRIDTVTCICNETELRRQMRDTTSARAFVERYGEPPLPAVDEGREIVEQAKKEGCLTPYQLERMEKMLVAVRRLKDYLSRGKAVENQLAYYEENLEPREQLREEIARQIRGEQVDDYATKELLHIRGEIERLQEKIRQKAEQTIRTHGNIMADSYCTVRDGRICVPVKKEYRKKLEGSLIDKSATGNTLFIEPEAVKMLQEELSVLKIDEENEVYRILYTLTAMVADCAEEMEENIRQIEKLDYIFSKGKLSMDMGAAEPRINVERRIHMKEARHPLMEKRTCVPLSLKMGDGIKGIVITGPNTGGKTVSVKTVALNCMMAQCGLHVTCGEADICMNSAYLCDIGDGQSLTENLSSFSSHIKNVLEIIGQADEESLVIMDELGSGTDPTEGMGIAIAIIQELKKTGCLFLLTTHYPEVKDYATGAEGIVNARMAFDRETLSPTYRMVIGEAGESCAFYIAQKLGMPAYMLEAASVAAYGKERAGSIHKQEPKKANPKNGCRKKNPGIQKTKKKHRMNLSEKFQIGDSVMVLPDRKIGIVCEKVNARGILRVQLPGRKIYINHKRVRLHVAATELYPEGYDFSIVFDTAEQRKLRHDMERKYVEETLEYPAGKK